MSQLQNQIMEMTLSTNVDTERKLDRTKNREFPSNIQDFIDNEIEQIQPNIVVQLMTPRHNPNTNTLNFKETIISKSVNHSNNS